MPVGTVAGHGVEHDEQASGDSDESELFGFSSGLESLIKVTEALIGSHRREGGQVQGPAQ